MPEVLIIIESDGQDQGHSTAITASIAQAMKRAASGEEKSGFAATSLKQVNVITADALTQGLDSGSLNVEGALLCPLTLHLPDCLEFPSQAIYQQCSNLVGVRSQVEEWHYVTGVGDLWLPVVLTTKGPIYAEAIGQNRSTSASADGFNASYLQPIHLTDQWRQPLYELSYRLLRSLHATPAVYLIQFGLHEQILQFDRLWPFPAAPAIASLDVQTPNLFECHWRCLLGQPIHDLVIR